MIDVKTLREKLIEACDAHIAAGGTIIDGIFGSNDAICPIAALTGITGPLDYHLRLQQALGDTISDIAFNALISAFDGSQNDDLFAGAAEFFKLGKELRLKYIGTRTR